MCDHNCPEALPQTTVQLELSNFDTSAKLWTSEKCKEALPKPKTHQSVKNGLVYESAVAQVQLEAYLTNNRIHLVRI